MALAARLVLVAAARFDGDCNVKHSWNVNHSREVASAVGLVLVAAARLGVNLGSLRLRRGCFGGFCHRRRRRLCLPRQPFGPLPGHHVLGREDEPGRPGSCAPSPFSHGLPYRCIQLMRILEYAPSISARRPPLCGGRTGRTRSDCRGIVTISEPAPPPRPLPHSPTRHPNNRRRRRPSLRLRLQRQLCAKSDKFSFRRRVSVRTKWKVSSSIRYRVQLYRCKLGSWRGRFLARFRICMGIF